MHVAEKGPEDAPVVLFLHGFPELWYTWRHQIQTLSSLGYRAVAPDLRGYGDTNAPEGASNYTYLHIVGDLVALINEMGVDQVYLVGHDWGAIIAWWFCVFRPDRVKALVNTSVHFIRRDPISILQQICAAYGDDYYICRFQVPGEMEAEIAEVGENGIDIFLKKLSTRTYCSAGLVNFPKGTWFHNVQPYAIFLSEDDIAYYRYKFENTGVTGPLNYYRAFDLSWEMTAPWMDAKVKVPTKFIVGDLDLTYQMPGVKDYLHKGGMKKDVPLLEDVVIVKGFGHFLHEEAPDLISKHIYDHIKKY